MQFEAGTQRLEKKRPPDAKMQKAFGILTTGLLALNSGDVLARNTTEAETENPEQNPNSALAERRLRELNAYLHLFGIDGLSLGEPEVVLDRPHEGYGLYIQDGHVGDIHSDTFAFPSGEAFVRATTSTLREAGHIDESTEIEMPSPVSVELSGDAQTLLEEWGGGVHGSTISFGHPEHVLRLYPDTREVAINAEPDAAALTITVYDHTGAVTVVTCEDQNITNIETQHG